MLMQDINFRSKPRFRHIISELKNWYDTVVFLILISLNRGLMLSGVYFIRGIRYLKVFDKW